MNEEERELYRLEYEQKKKNGIPFFPDAVFKDAVVALVVFVAIVGLASLVGTSLEEIADPSDSSYTPRPEWYFLFLFQLLKYFPGDLEVVGVFVIPTLALVFLVLLPWIDRSADRHWSSRPLVTGITLFLLVGSIWLSVEAVTAAPPPSDAADGGDPTARLYVENCAGCHGSLVQAEPGVDLFDVIQGGTHDGMPAWNADLTASEIDALVGFILAPNGHDLYVSNCSQCHDTQSLIEADTAELRRALEEGQDYGPHATLGLPDWEEVLAPGYAAKLLNFLTAPDGHRLWTQECASCHGQSVAYAGDDESLEQVIRSGGGHLQMPAFESDIAEADIDTLALYVTDPAAAPDEAATLFGLNCAQCHATQVPRATDYEEARELIALGGAHQDMPVWGEILTDEQIDALIAYVRTSGELPDLARAEQIYIENCSSCHGALGEGGVNPTRPGDIIAPISTAEYLSTRDDATLQAIISQGQPNFGMSPFGQAFGGPLTTEQVDLLVAYMRAWESNPPVDLPPEIPSTPGAGQGAESLFVTLCSQCHGTSGEGGLGPAFDPAWQATKTDEEIFDDINLGHPATPMIAWGEILTSSQIQELVQYVRTLTGEATEGGSITYVSTIQPIFNNYCTACHGSLGGWTGTSYEEAMAPGEGGRELIIPGDPDNSPLVQSLIGTHPDGIVMPPSVEMSPADIQKIIDWVAAGAPKS
jgi:menaquinol-cytochrome c reductase cytochrome b/c subunit